MYSIREILTQLLLHVTDVQHIGARRGYILESYSVTEVQQISIAISEASNDDHIVRNIQWTSDVKNNLKFKVNLKFLTQVACETVNKQCKFYIYILWHVCWKPELGSQQTAVVRERLCKQARCYAIAQRLSCDGRNRRVRNNRRAVESGVLCAIGAEAI
jgi:hypothetical protein